MNPLAPLSKLVRKQVEKWRFSRMTMDDVFGHIYRSNKWGSEESRSGKGSSLTQTRQVREALPGLLQSHGIRSMLDLPCGDFHWMKEVDLRGVEYVGADIVPELIAETSARHAGPGRKFLTLNLTADPLPKADLLMCRDCWVHLTAGDIAQAIANIRRSGITYLLATTFTRHAVNGEKIRGKFRMLNLQVAPFCFPAPLEVITEDNLESSHADAGKSLALWRVADLPDPKLG